MLANELEPLILADGTKINPSTGKVIKDKSVSSVIEIPAPTEAQRIVANTRRTIADMPLPSRQMNGVSLVCFYTMWGLTTQEIAIQLGISISQVDSIRELPEYIQLQDDIKKSILEHDSTDLRNFFTQKSRSAANKIVTIMDEDEGALGFAAAKDILDRAGHRPADIVEHRHKMEDSLKIQIIQKKDVSDLPLIDAEYREI